MGEEQAKRITDIGVMGIYCFMSNFSSPMAPRRFIKKRRDDRQATKNNRCGAEAAEMSCLW